MTTTFAPHCPKQRAMPKPMPEWPPVTKATLPSRQVSEKMDAMVLS